MKNIESICREGYDPKLRRRKKYGKGDYFGTTPDISMKYCKGGKKMLLNELLLGKHGTHYTQDGNILVIKDPTRSLPRYVITVR